MDIINTLNLFYKNFQGEKFSIGKSLDGREILCIKKGNKSPVIIAQFSIHAREWITSLLALKFIENFNADATVYFILNANPDGIALATRGLSAIRNAEIKSNLKKFKKFKLWKANANAVDLNVNFNANWGKGIKNVFEPNGENYVGNYFESEPETKALVNFTKKIHPDATISFHSKGEEIYWYFNQEKAIAERDYKLALTLSKSNGYKVKYTLGSVGGYKDWCISELKIPSFTIEVGSDALSHPITEKYIDEIYEKNKNLLKDFSKELLWTIK